MRMALLLLLMIAFSSQTSFSQESGDEFIKGVYGNPGTLLKAGYSFDSLGMNAVFVRSVSLNREFYETSKKQGVKVFVEFPTLNGKEYLNEHPDAWPIDEKGEKSPPADWFMGICPTHPGFKEFRSEQLKEILREYEVEGFFWIMCIGMPNLKLLNPFYLKPAFAIGALEILVQPSKRRFPEKLSLSGPSGF